MVLSSGFSDSLAVKGRPHVLPVATTCLYLQVLSTVCKLLLLWRNRDGLLLHSGPERRAFADSQQIPPIHLLHSLLDRCASGRGSPLLVC